MTPPESPSSLLERAATKLEDLATDAAPAPWTVIDEHQVGGAWFAACDQVDQWHEGVKAHHRLIDAKWIEALSPAVAQPLVNILRGVAFTLKCHPEYADIERNYVALAEAILGEPVPGEDSP